MKKPIIILIVLVILAGIVWVLGGNRNGSDTDSLTATSTGTVSAPVNETVKVSDTLSEFKNEELGFTVKYPSAWEKTAGPTDVTFVIPTGKTNTNTIGKLEAKVSFIPGKCAFPPVTTIKQRETAKYGNLSLNMISMSNSVQGRDYFDRMYSHQRDNICYILSFSSITLSPTSKGFKGSEATQMTNNNKALVDGADQAFVNMVKSFAYAVGPTGQDEAKANPAR